MVRAKQMQKSPVPLRQEVQWQWRRKLSGASIEKLADLLKTGPKGQGKIPR